MQKAPKTKKSKDRSYRLTIREEDLLAQQKSWEKKLERKPVMPEAHPSKPKRKDVDLREELIPLACASDGMRWYAIACDESKEAGEYWIERVTKTGSHITNLSRRFKRRSEAVDTALNEYEMYQKVLDGQEDFE